MVPPLMRPALTSTAPCQMIMMIDPKARKMTIAVMTARSSIRFLAVANTRSTASEKRERSRSCWLNAWTIFIAPRTSLVTVPTSAMRSWLMIETARTFRPTMVSGMTISGTPSSSRPASLGARKNRMMAQAMPMTRLRKRDRHGGADDLLDDRGVDGDPAGDFGRAVLLEEAGREAQQVAVNREADVGDGPLAQPRDEIKAHRGRQRHHRDQQQEVFEPAGEAAGRAVVGGEALVDDQLEGIGDARRGRRGEHEGDGGDRDMPRVADREPPDHAQASE